jgi:hypothetical protein
MRKNYAKRVSQASRSKSSEKKKLPAKIHVDPLNWEIDKLKIR